MTARFRVTFDYKNANNLLVEDKRTFSSLKAAILYVKVLQAGQLAGQLVGKPTIERVGK